MPDSLPVPPSLVVDTSRSPHARLRPVPLDAVTLNDSFLAPRCETNRQTTLASQFQHIEETARLDNFRRASGRKTGIGFTGIFFNDSDVYKWLEAAASTLAARPDAPIEKMVQTAIDEVAAAQQDDGYLNTYFTFEREGERWTNLKDMHEMYCAGHLFQAAVAHYRAAGDRTLLDVAVRFADLLCKQFGDESGKRPAACGHPEAEMALVELFRATGKRQYLELARHMVDVRGRTPSAIGETSESGHRYMQDHVPYRDLSEVTGHAVRMIYLACGAADVYLETGEQSLWDALMAQWDNLFTRRMYVSGGLGARYEGEAFGKDYELPNTRAYTETCAAIASAMWNHRLLLATGEARFADLLEHTLYNAVLPGLSLSGDEYYYQNPLADDGTHRRQKWFGCACCPPNVARLLPQLPGYFYSTTDDSDVYLHLYAQSTAVLPLPNGSTAHLTVATDYPWEGDIRVTIQSAGEFGLFLRVPYWCGSGASLAVNAEDARPVEAGTYVHVRREWKEGDGVTLRLPLPVRRLQCHPFVTENAGQVAVMRGPILYCLEAADNPEANLGDLVLPDRADVTPQWEPELLGGVVTLSGVCHAADAANTWGSALYREHTPGAIQPMHREVSAKFVPYYAWANREPGAMRVWVRAV